MFTAYRSKPMASKAYQARPQDTAQALLVALQDLLGTAPAQENVADSLIARFGALRPFRGLTVRALTKGRA